MPNSASCERGFSKLGWLSGKYRINLSTQSLESLAKMSSYYLSNLKKELTYYGRGISTEQIEEIIYSLDLDEDNDNDDFNSDELNIIANERTASKRTATDVIIDWHPLHMEKFVNLNNSIFTKNIEIIQDNSDISDKETDNTNSTSEEEEEVDYNPNEIAENVYYNE